MSVHYYAYAPQSARGRLQDMMTQYCGPSPVYPDMKKLREVLTQLSDEQKLHILQQRYPRCWTPLHWAAWRGHTKILSTLLLSLRSSAERLKVLMVHKWTPLHVAALYGHSETVTMILDWLTADQQLQIMSVQWGGKTAIQYAETSRHTDIARVLRDRAENLMTEEYSKMMIIIPLLLIILPGVMGTLTKLTLLC